MFHLRACGENKTITCVVSLFISNSCFLLHFPSLVSLSSLTNIFSISFSRSTWQSLTYKPSQPNNLCIYIYVCVYLFYKLHVVLQTFECYCCYFDIMVFGYAIWLLLRFLVFFCCCLRTNSRQFSKSSKIYAFGALLSIFFFRNLWKAQIYINISICL